MARTPTSPRRTTARPLHYVAAGHGGRPAAVLAAHGAGAVGAAAGAPEAVRPRGEPEARAQDSQCQSFPKSCSTRHARSAANIQKQAANDQ